jgi:hypothetical protein
MTCRLCGGVGEGSLCRDCRAELAAVSADGLACALCGATIRTGYVSIRGHCYGCHEQREPFAALASGGLGVIKEVKHGAAGDAEKKK